ncbi:hypothetical protein [Marinomonas sp. MED121]|nr:hypothetical protein [Marinomonas sp. MED121]
MSPSNALPSLQIVIFCCLASTGRTNSEYAAVPEQNFAASY